ILPYRVSIRMGGAGEGVLQADCTCPYGVEWGGWCKHIVATLLAAVREPDTVEEQPPLDSLLENLHRDQLQSLLVELTARQPELYDVVVSLLPRPSAPEAAEVLPPVTVDAAAVRRRVRGALRGLSGMRASEAYWYVGSVVEGVREVLQEARAYLDVGDGRSALAVLEAVTDEYVRDWTELDDSNGEGSSFFRELAPLWTEALLTARLTRAEREESAGQLEDWDAEIADYFEDVFGAAVEAARLGWDDPALVRVLKGESSSSTIPEELESWFAEELTEARLNVLERQERHDEALNLARAEGRAKRYALILVKLGRIPEAVEHALAQIETAGEALEVARALDERGATDEALQVAERGLSLDSRPRGWGFSGELFVAPSRAPLALWLRERAAEHGRPELALRAAEVAFREAPGLDTYLRARELAGDRWSALREELLKRLRGKRGWAAAGAVEVFLHEALIDDALDTVQGSWDYALIARVADAAAELRPERVIPICRKQAEDIVDRGKAGLYHKAAEWLRRARTAYLAAGREEEWSSYLEELIATHQRKYKLRPLLEELRRG
ncbi:MAG TPA: SWIM zinc finger family protein, partial [Longimicrobiaceae bacterium]|nr:SWIM zinc finger family protein [Longimicrobiaceae bacterium]